MIRSFIPNQIGYKDYYKKLPIPKKNGGIRIVYVPTPELKQIQHFIKEKYLSSFPVSEHAMAYVGGKSIVDNASMHRHNTSFLFVDVHNFFNSINFEMLFNILKKYNATDLDDFEIRTMLLLCSHNHEFAQGCVTSPLLSNIYLYEFDRIISDIISDLPNGLYTRYSDDITISSSEKIPIIVKTKIEEELKKYNLTINKKKTHFSSNVDNIRITGVRVKRNGEITLDTTFKKKLKTRIYHKYMNIDKSTGDIEELIGLINYLKMVDAKYYNKINFKYVKNNMLCIEWLHQSLK